MENSNVTYRLTIGKKYGEPSVRLLSAPNMQGYIKALIRKDMEKRRCAFPHEKPDRNCLYFDTDYSNTAETASCLVRLSDKNDSDIIRWLGEQDIPAPQYMRELVFTDCYGEDWGTMLALAQDAIKRENELNRRRFNFSISVYYNNSDRAVRQLSMQSNVLGYIRNLIREDMRRDPVPIFDDHVGQRSQLRYTKFNSEALMRTWRDYKDRADALRLSIIELEREAVANYLSDEDAAEYKKLKADYKEICNYMEAGEYEQGEHPQKFMAVLDSIKRKQTNLKMKAIAAMPESVQSKWQSLTTEYRLLRVRLEKLNRKLHNCGVKRVNFALEMTSRDKAMTKWLEEKQYCEHTQIPDYNYWLSLGKDYSFDCGFPEDETPDTYKRQPGRALGFYVCQLINYDIDRNGFGDRALSRELPESDALTDIDPYAVESMISTD